MMHNALTIALQECNANVVEIPGTQHNPRILEYHITTSLKATSDEVPWCAAFVNWCLENAGLEGTNSAQARSFLKWGSTVPLGSIQAGDIVVFSRGDNPQQGHVAFFVEWADKKKNLINVVGGNQSNRVSMISYSLQKLLSVRRKV